jgi:hypothetical protein
MENSKLSYALLAHVVRQGGFLVVLVIRYSAIPSHCAFQIFTCTTVRSFTYEAAVATVVFATVGKLESMQSARRNLVVLIGISFPVFLGAAILSLPEAFVPVYVGYAMKNNSMFLSYLFGQALIDYVRPLGSTSSTVKNITLAITLVITVGALIWIRKLQEKAKPEVIYVRRKARQGKLCAYKSSLLHPLIIRWVQCNRAATPHSTMSRYRFWLDDLRACNCYYSCLQN